MNKHEAKLLREELQATITPILESHGLKLTGANAKFDDSTFNMSIKSVDPTAPISTWDLSSVGLPEGVKAGLRFNWNDKHWEFVGINLRARKFPIKATDVGSGKEYKLPRGAAVAMTAAHEEVSNA